MRKKSTPILVSILHICILGICILTMYSNKSRTSEAMIAHVSSDTKVMDSQTKPDAETQPGPETKPDTENHPAPETKPDTENHPAPETKPDTENHPAPETIPETETPPETNTETETPPETNTEAEPSPIYSFHYFRTRSNLNIRSAPSTNDKVIGKIPCGGDGSVLELTNDEWALIEYQGTIGYCSRRYIILREIDNTQE